MRPSGSHPPGADVPALVTIAIPTFNRSELLMHAVESARAQDHPSVDICIIDNHSTDDTSDLCQALAASDPRIRYIRQAANVGPTRNFETGLANARGEYFMWLADDDWLAKDYVRLCHRALREGGHILVVGRDLWEFPDRTVPERLVEAQDLDPLKRVVRYMNDVASNVALYGLGRTADFQESLPFPPSINGDIVWVATLLAKGTLGVVPEAEIHRRAGGSSTDLGSLATQVRAGRLTARFPRVAIPIETVRGIVQTGALRSYPASARLLALLQIGVAMWVKTGAGDEITAPLRSGLQSVMPASAYDRLRRLYRPVRKAQFAVRRMIVRSYGS